MSKKPSWSARKEINEQLSETLDDEVESEHYYDFQPGVDRSLEAIMDERRPKAVKPNSSFGVSLLSEPMKQMLWQRMQQQSVEYVCLDNNGLEAFFDVGVSYLGKAAAPHEGYILVMDRFGDERTVVPGRFRVLRQPDD